MLRRPTPTAHDEAGAEVRDEARAVAPGFASAPVEPIAPPTLAAIGLAGITRHRAAFLVGTFATIWIVAVFVRQVGDATAATRTADGIRRENAALAVEVAALESELVAIQNDRYVGQQARAFRLGSAKERPFELESGTLPLAPDAPGSAALRLGAPEPAHSPLETWLELLFGSPDR